MGSGLHCFTGRAICARYDSRNFVLRMSLVVLAYDYDAILPCFSLDEKQGYNYQLTISVPLVSSIMSSAASAVPLGPTYGAELLATFVSVALWGTTCMQT